MRILVSFLGRARQPNQAEGYRWAKYRLENQGCRPASASDGMEKPRNRAGSHAAAQQPLSAGSEDIFETQYFGLGLARRLQVDRLLLLGTASSMWDVLLEQQLVRPEAVKIAGLSEDDRLALIEACQAGAVTRPLLEQFRPALEALTGQRLTLELIPMALDSESQARILSRLAELLQPGDEVVFDITHGLRHLAMLALVAAILLERLRRIRVADIYYGALEARAEDGVAPVVNLSGMLDLLRWIQAFSAYDAGGNYSVFQPLFHHPVPPPAKLPRLSQAAFEQSCFSVSQARKHLLPYLTLLQASANPPLKLFAPELAARLAWIRQQHRDEWELAVGDAALDRGDYLRAAAHYQEAFISRRLRHRPHAQRRDAREEAEESLARQFEAYRNLRNLRNLLVHGDRSKNWQGRKEILDLLTDEVRMCQAISGWRNELERKIQPGELAAAGALD